MHLEPNSAQPQPVHAGLTEPITARWPTAKGGWLWASGDGRPLQTSNLIALRYVDADGSPVAYPANPNGSVLNIAALCNPAGNVLGLMPHPENHVFPWQHPRPGGKGAGGLRLFINGVKAYVNAPRIAQAVPCHSSG